MNQHMSEETMRRAMSGEAEPEAKLTVLRHLASCPECTAIARSVSRNDLQALANHFVDGDTAPASHLDEATQLRPHLTRRLDDAETEIVLSHLDDCAQCRARLEVLRAERRRSRIYAIAASIAIAAVLSAIVIMTREPARNAPIAVRQSPPPPQTPVHPPATPTKPIDPEWQQLVARAVEQRRLPFPAVLATLTMPNDATRGRDGEVARMSPAGVIVDDVRPHFSWPATKNSTYVAYVFDGEREVAHSAQLRRNEWRPAADLPRGRTLAWQVEIRQDGETGIIPSPPASPAMFRIITSNEAREIARVAAEKDPLVLAVVYARSGLRDAALKHLRLAAEQGNAGAEQILRNIDEP
jgi:anti-sigma factor RsiW